MECYSFTKLVALFLLDDKNIFIKLVNLKTSVKTQLCVKTHQ